MKRFARPVPRAVLFSEVSRWREFAQTVLAYLADPKHDKPLRGKHKLSETLYVLGQDGPLNPCVRLREEVGKRLYPPRVHPGQPGVDFEALTRDNADDLRRFADEVIRRCNQHDAVTAAGRRMGRQGRDASYIEQFHRFWSLQRIRCIRS